MRLLASGDNHFSEHLRFQECIDVHAWMVEQAKTVEADVFLDGGDIFDAASSPIERRAVADWLTAMAEVCPVVIAKGNHDRPKDLALFRRLQTKHPIIVEEACGVHHVAGAAIATMAWPERGHLLAALGSSGAVDIDMRRALQGVMTMLGGQLAQHDGPRIGLGHFMVDGSVTSTGQPLLGMPINVSLADLDLLCASLVVMDHIHVAQRWTLPSGGIAVYTGSPFRTDFGQLETKSILYAEYSGSRLAFTEEIKTPCSPMVHAESIWDAERRALVFAGDPPSFKGGEIRLRYEVTAEHRDAARIAAAELRGTYLALGAKSVKIEEQVIATKRARAPEVARALSIADKLDAHWASIGFEPTGGLRESLITRAQELEQEALSCA